MALRGDTVVVRAAWWAGPDDAQPAVLDWFGFTETGRRRRVAAHRRHHGRRVLNTTGPGLGARSGRLGRGAGQGGRGRRGGHETVRAALPLRVDPACGLPPRPSRLEYRPESDDEVFLAALREMSRGSLDAHAQRVMAAAGPDADPLTVAAQEELESLRWFPSPREWWRLAYTPAGELVGLTVPARNYGGPVIGLIGVVADQRGHGYGYDLLVETTWMLVREGAEKIAAATDVTNKPMAAAFARAGYPIVQQRYDLA